MNPLIADFGISKLKEKDNEIYWISTFKGTKNYISPEKFELNFKGVETKINEEKNDVFAIGVIFIKMLGYPINDLNSD